MTPSLTAEEREALEAALAVTFLDTDGEYSTRVGHMSDLVPAVEQLIDRRVAEALAPIERLIATYEDVHAEELDDLGPHPLYSVAYRECVSDLRAALTAARGGRDG